MSAANVIDVRVRDDDGFDGEPVALHDFENLGNVVAGIDHDSVARLLVAEDGAVAFEHAHTQDLVDHD